MHVRLLRRHRSHGWFSVPSVLSLSVAVALMHRILSFRQASQAVRAAGRVRPPLFELAVLPVDDIDDIVTGYHFDTVCVDREEL